MGDEEARRARIEARRRRLTALESQEWEPGEVTGGDSAPAAAGGEPPARLQARAAAHTGRAPLSPVCEDVDQVRPPKPHAQPIRRSDHQDVFGKRSSAAEGLVDPAWKPKSLPDAVASILDLDFASVERASARMSRTSVERASARMSRHDAAAVAEADAAQLAHKAAVLAADAANRPRAGLAPAARAAGAAGALTAGKAHISDDEERALQRLMVGPREEADGATGAGDIVAKGKGYAKDGVIGEDGMNAIDAKAMDRLARQNDELRKLAKAQRLELQACAARIFNTLFRFASSSNEPSPSPANACTSCICIACPRPLHLWR
jgi:hypothetical protein